MFKSVPKTTRLGVEFNKQFLTQIPDLSTTFFFCVVSGRSSPLIFIFFFLFLFLHSIIPLLLSLSLKNLKMASETEIPDLSSAFERILRQRDVSLFMPFILGFPTTTNSTTSSNERIILINPFTQGMVVIEGTSTLDSLLRNLGTKNGHPPASKASIEAMPSVEIEDKNGECVICLEEWELGGVAKEMPCKHRFHGNCIEKWLGIHGSCPVCRYKMPVDEIELGKKTDDDDEEEEEGRERRRFDREIWVSFSFNRRNEDSNQIPSTQSDDDLSSSNSSLDQQMEGR